MVSFGLVKAALLTFGTACGCTPWPDGAASSVVGLLQFAAKKCKNDQETIASNVR
jgi:hypothetical protein